MKNITLRQLRYFEALARFGHFGRAAEDCAISQPALSMQIRELETEMGADLLEKQSRSPRLTRLGEALVEKARAILHAVDELETLSRAGQDGFMGQLRLGIIPTIAPYLLPSFLQVLAKQSPGLDVQLRESLTPKLLAETREGRIDAAILALPVSESELAEMPIFSEEFVLVRPLSEAGKPVPGPQSLKEMRLLLLEEGHCFRDQALSFCDLSAKAPKEMLEASSLSTLVQMVAAGIGVTLIPEMAVKVETRSAPVAIARFANPKPSRTIGMVWRKTNPLATRLEAIARLVQQAAKPLGN